MKRIRLIGSCVAIGGAALLSGCVAVPGPGYYGSPYYGSAWGAWGAGWGSPYMTESVRTDTKVLVETRVYSLEQKLLVWAGTSETWNPSHSDDVIRELSEAVSKEMQRAHLIAPKSK